MKPGRTGGAERAIAKMSGCGDAQYGPAARRLARHLLAEMNRKRSALAVVDELALLAYDCSDGARSVCERLRGSSLTEAQACADGVLKSHLKWHAVLIALREELVNEEDRAREEFKKVQERAERNALE